MRALNKLTARGLEKYAREGRPGSRLGDGGGLYAVKRSTGTVSWTWIGTHEGKTVERGLGSVKDVTLAQAREKAVALRRDGVPTGGDGAGGSHVQTFARAARDYRKAFEGTWKTLATAREFDSVTRTYCAAIADVDVGELGVKDVLRVLDACDGRPTMQAAALSIVRRVIDREIARGHRSPDSVNPAEASRIRLIRPIVHRTTHFASMPYAQVGAFVATLRSKDTPAARALELLVLTGLRSNEVRGLLWSEVDFNSAMLTIDAPRMKAGRIHRVPLTRRALELLSLQRDVATGDHVFPGPQGRPITDSGFRHLLPQGATAHGFRSSLRQFLADRTDVSQQVAEGILAHAVLGVEGAYRRDASIDKAGAALKQWADFVNAG